MTDSSLVPAARAAIVNGSIPTTEFHRFLRAIARSAGLTSETANQVVEIIQKVTEIEERGTGTLVAGVGIDIQGILAAGLAKVSLEQVVQEDGGALQRVLIDGTGRVVESGPADSDDLVEGTTNKYFTNARVAAALAQGAGISLSVDGAGVTTISSSGGSSTNLAMIWASQ